MVSAQNAFALAYQWWLNCDAYFLTLEFARDGKWVREIGGKYGVDRTISENAEKSMAKLVLDSAQSADSSLERRAARLSRALENRPTTELKRLPTSAACKLSWFVCPQGWTMFDRYAAQGVLGTGGTTGIPRMERFYAALALRGWVDTLSNVRREIPQQFCQLLAERTLDKHFFLLGRAKEEDGDREMVRTERQINAFLDALSPELRDSVCSTGNKIAGILREANLGYRDDSDRGAINKRVKELREMKEDVA